MSVEAHKRMVRLVMGALNEAVENERINCEMVGRIAIEIVAKLRGASNLVILDGEFLTVETWWRNPLHGDIRYPDTTRYEIYVPDSEDLVCEWCSGPYGRGEAGAPHRLCRNCHQYGPSDN